MSYLAEAATEISRALDANTARERDTRHLDDHGPVRAAIRDERLRIIDRLIALAAVEAGVTPARIG